MPAISWRTWGTIALVVLCGGAASFLLWKIAPEENRPFNFIVIFGVVVGLALAAATFVRDSLAERHHDEQIREQAKLLQRLVAKAELTAGLTVSFVFESQEVNRVSAVLDASERHLPGVIEEETGASGALIAFNRTTTYRRAADLVPVRVRITNTGAVPADGVLATFTLPRGVEAYDDGEFYSYSALSGLSSNIPILNTDSWGLTVPHDDSRKNNRRRRSLFECGAEEIGNHRQCNFDPVWLRFPQSEMEMEYSIMCELVADGLEPIAETLTISVRWK